MNKTSAAMTVCPYFVNDGEDYIRCEFAPLRGAAKLTGSLEKKQRFQEEYCYNFGYKRCPIAAANEEEYRKRMKK